MASYNIYGYDNASEDPPVLYTVVLNDDDSEIVSINCDDPQRKEGAETSLVEYMDFGFTAKEAILRAAGSYGDVKEANPDGSLVAAAEDSEASSDTAAAPFEIGDGIMAMTEDDGTVVTLLKKSPDHGADYRHDGAWLPLIDPTVMDDLTFVGVTDSAEGVYDRYEADDKLVTIGHYYPSAEGPFWPHPVRIYDEPETADEAAANIDTEDEGDVEGAAAVSDGADEDTEPLAASVTLDSVADLDEAIAAAIEDPDLQWYVSRRVTALGIEASLPWSKD